MRGTGRKGWKVTLESSDGGTVTWGKVDDQFHAHRKAKRAWKADRGALGLHLLALSYCAGHLTDGLVDDEFVEEKLPVSRERASVTAALVDAGLWLREDGGWRINDWLDFNPSREEVLDRRRRDSERKKQKESKRTPNGSRAESNGSPDEPSRAGAFPDPTRPDPTTPFPFPLNPPPSGGRKRQHEVWDKTAIAWARSVATVDGSDPSLLRAVTQAKPWDMDDPVSGFRSFARRWFPDSLQVNEEAA